MADLSYGGCETYMAAAKDTVSAVSKHFGVAESWLKRINCLAGDTLENGQTLIIRRPAAPSVLIYRGDTPQKKIALTYDCGDSGAGETPALLDMLSRNRVRASFFLVGEWAEQFPDLSRRIAGEGHEIGNHSYSHPDYTKLSAEEIRQDILRGEDAIRRVTGVETRPFFRFPYGYFSQPALEAVGLAGFSHSFQWSIDPRDWEQPPVDAITRQVLGAAAPGDIVLLHSVGKNTPKATEIIIRTLSGKGFGFVTVSDFV